MLWKDALKTSRAGVTHEGAAGPNGWFQRSLFREPQRLSGSLWAVSDRSRCWAAGNQAGADTSLEPEQNKASAVLMLLLTLACGQIVVVSDGPTGLGVSGHKSLSGTRGGGFLALSAALAEHEPAGAGGRKAFAQ